MLSTRFRLPMRWCLLVAALASLGAARAATAGLPECTIVGRALSCGPSHLCASIVSDDLDYLWTGPEGFSSTKPCIDAAIDGRYVLRVASKKSQEFSECEISIKVLSPPPCNIEGQTTFCRGGSTDLCGPEGEFLTYVWSGADKQPISTERCLHVTEPGTYELEVFDGACRSRCATKVDFASGPACGGEKPEGCGLTGKGKQQGESKKGKGKTEFEWSGKVNRDCKSGHDEWKHVDKLQKLQFESRSIQVVSCGGLDDPKAKDPSGFIEFEGTGRIKGNVGKKVDADFVYFRAHVEDRSESDDSGKGDSETGDRYFLHVFSNPADPNGSTLMLVDEDGNPATVDPIVVEHGKMEIRASDCAEKKDGAPESFAAPSVEPVAGGVRLAPPRPNPASRITFVRFSLPRDESVSLTVHDVTGRRIRELASGLYSAGDHQIVWDFGDDQGHRVAGGVFFIRLMAGGRAHQQSVAVIP